MWMSFIYNQIYVSLPFSPTTSPSSLFSLPLFSVFLPSLHFSLSHYLFCDISLLCIFMGMGTSSSNWLPGRNVCKAIISQDKCNFHIILFKVLVLNILFWWSLKSTIRKRGPRENECHFLGYFLLPNKFKLHNKIFYKTVLHIIIF